MSRVPLEDRISICALSRDGQSQRSIASRFGYALNTVNRIVRAYRNEGRIADAAHRRRPRSTTRQEDERIASAAFDQPSITAAKIRGQLGLQVSLRTIRRRLHDAGLRSRIACQKPLLTSRHKEQRVAFAEAHRDWDASDWASVIFTDESTFTSEWDQQKRVWRPTCKR